MIRLRSTTLRSSRTLPCQAWRSSAAIYPLSIVSIRRPILSANCAAKNRAYSAISPGRSRSDGRWMRKTERRKKRSSRKFPEAISFSRSRFVAAMIRRSTLVGRVSPILMNSPHSSTRSSLACSSTGISPISSRKSVPLSASSNNPFLSLVAPVKLPARWPNNSLSSSSLEKAEQLTATNAPFARGLAWWMACAKTSLPVPVSPVSSTEVSVTATLRASATALRRASDEPMMRSNECSSESLSSRRASRRCICAFSVARLSSGNILLLSSPLVM